MRIDSWMTHDPISVFAETSLSKCQKLLKEHHIRRLPVVDEDRRLIGIISDRDVRAASPSQATSLEVHEMQYLLAGVKARDIMTPSPVTVGPQATVGEAALLMLERKIGGVPVVDKDRRLVGIITDQDIFKVLVAISGASMPGIDLTVETGTEPGSLGRVFDAIRDHGGRVVSVMTEYLDSGSRRLFVRLRPLEDEAGAKALREALEACASLQEWTQSPGSAS